MIEFDGRSVLSAESLIKLLKTELGAVEINLPPRIKQIHERFMKGEKITRTEREEHARFFDRIGREASMPSKT